MTSSRPPLPAEGRRRVVIAEISPQVECGAFPVKRCLGDEFVVEARARRRARRRRRAVAVSSRAGVGMAFDRHDVAPQRLRPRFLPSRRPGAISPPSKAGSIGSPPSAICKSGSRPGRTAVELQIGSQLVLAASSGHAPADKTTWRSNCSVTANCWRAAAAVGPAGSGDRRRFAAADARSARLVAGDAIVGRIPRAGRSRRPVTALVRVLSAIARRNRAGTARSATAKSGWPT